MRILAIDSSGLVATVAVVEEENEISKTIAEYTICLLYTSPSPRD